MVVIIFVVFEIVLVLTSVCAEEEEHYVRMKVSGTVNKDLPNNVLVSCFPFQYSSNRPFVAAELIGVTSKRFAAALTPGYGVVHSPDMKVYGQIPKKNNFWFLQATVYNLKQPELFHCVLTYNASKTSIAVSTVSKWVNVTGPDEFQLKRWGYGNPYYKAFYETDLKLKSLNQDVMSKLEEMQGELQSLSDEANQYRREKSAEAAIAYLETHSVQKVLDNTEFMDTSAVMFVANQGQQDVFQTDGSILVYTNVTVNMGNGYNNLTGTFRAPFPGYYMFHYTIFAAYRAWIYVKLMSNGNVLKTIVSSSDDNYWQQYVDGSCVVRLEKLQEVHLAVGSVGGVIIDNTFRDPHNPNRFGGYMLKAITF